MISEEWEAGYKAGYEFCEMLSNAEEGSEHEFWGGGMGVFRHGFAEGSKTGQRDFMVSWKWIDPIDRPNIVVKGPTLKIIS